LHQEGHPFLPETSARAQPPHHHPKPVNPQSVVESLPAFPFQLTLQKVAPLTLQKSLPQKFSPQRYTFLPAEGLSTVAHHKPPVPHSGVHGLQLRGHKSEHFSPQIQHQHKPQSPHTTGAVSGLQPFVSFGRNSKALKLPSKLSAHHYKGSQKVISPHIIDRPKVPEIPPTAPHCPFLPALPYHECHNHISTCWSVGQPDLDCPHSAPCCFDGCANTCLSANPQLYQEGPPLFHQQPVHDIMLPSPSHQLPGLASSLQTTVSNYLVHNPPVYNTAPVYRAPHKSPSSMYHPIFYQDALNSNHSLGKDQHHGRPKERGLFVSGLPHHRPPPTEALLHQPAEPVPTFQAQRRPNLEIPKPNISSTMLHILNPQLSKLQLTRADRRPLPTPSLTTHPQPPTTPTTAQFRPTPIPTTTKFLPTATTTTSHLGPTTSSRCHQPRGGGSYTCISFGSPHKPIFAFHTIHDKNGFNIGAGSGFLQPAPDQIDTQSSIESNLLHTHSPRVNNLMNAEFRKNFAIVRKRRQRGRKARKTHQRKKWKGRKSEKKKKKVEASSKTVEKVTRLDINLTDPLPTYEELLLEIFQTGSRQSAKKTHSKIKSERASGFSGSDFQAAIKTTPPADQLAAVQEPPPSIQPYEYPLNFTLDFQTKTFAVRPVSLAIAGPTTIPASFNTPPYFTPVNAQSDNQLTSKKKKPSKNEKSELRKRQKSFTRRLKEHKPSRPTPTPFQNLDV